MYSAKVFPSLFFSSGNVGAKGFRSHAAPFVGGANPSAWPGNLLFIAAEPELFVRLDISKNKSRNTRAGVLPCILSGCANCCTVDGDMLFATGLPSNRIEHKFSIFSKSIFGSFSILLLERSSINKFWRLESSAGTSERQLSFNFKVSSSVKPKMSGIQRGMSRLLKSNSFAFDLFARRHWVATQELSIADANAISLELD
mmetsp:Transcript_97551/g.154335  ORF Transcript_97551/g.154335 Transcript_97551/m.154335 type:complete len:200 (+) Transcript_97551:1180-1779(+)